MTQKNHSLFFDENENYSHYCGIDEAGRGPIAGPLVMVGVILNKEIKNLKDSKKLTQKQRETFFENIVNNSKYYIYEASSIQIDRDGLSRVIKDGLESIKSFFKDAEFIFDGNSSYRVANINTLIKADDKVASVKAASIIAKVYRDKKMIEYAKEYPEYGFENHKGYGTKAHLEAIAKYGYCKIHRRSFKIKLPTL